MVKILPCKKLFSQKAACCFPRVKSHQKSCSEKAIKITQLGFSVIEGEVSQPWL